MVSIGVIGVQGAVSEHVLATENALDKLGLKGKVSIVKTLSDLDGVDGVILPGGESTTISRMLGVTDLLEAIMDKIKDDDIPVMGTCAGCVLLAKKVVDKPKDLQLLELMNMEVERNAFGRQRESFEQLLEIEGFTKPFNAVFIRAPVIKRVWGSCNALSYIDDKIVMAKEKKFLAIAFHPELTSDTRVHEYFISLI